MLDIWTRLKWAEYCVILEDMTIGRRGLKKNFKPKEANFCFFGRSRVLGRRQPPTHAKKRTACTHRRKNQAAHVGKEPTRYQTLGRENRISNQYWVIPTISKRAQLGGWNPLASMNLHFFALGYSYNLGRSSTWGLESSSIDELFFALGYPYNLERSSTWGMESSSTDKLAFFFLQVLLETCWFHTPSLLDLFCCFHCYYWLI